MLELQGSHFHEDVADLIVSTRLRFKFGHVLKLDTIARREVAFGG
jgi:hypothetical protein